MIEQCTVVVVIFVVVVVATKENAAAAANAVFLIEIEIDQGVVGVGID